MQLDVCGLVGRGVTTAPLREINPCNGETQPNWIVSLFHL